MRQWCKRFGRVRRGGVSISLRSGGSTLWLTLIRVLVGIDDGQVHGVATGDDVYPLGDERLWEAAAVVAGHGAS